MRFAKRAEGNIEKNALARLLEEKRSRGERILDLTESNPTKCRFQFWDKRLLAALDDPTNLRYEPDPLGLPEAREAIAQTYAEKGIKVKPEEIFLTSSTSEAYGYIFRLLLDPGDCIHIPRPGYPLFEHLARLHDVEIGTYPLVYRDGWSLDRDALEEGVRRSRGALVIVNPHNPTGHYVSEEERDFLIELSRETMTPIIADEVFHGYRIPLADPVPGASKGTGAREPISFASSSDTLMFVLGGLSKGLALPQMKLSWAVVRGPENLTLPALARLELILDTFLSVSTPVARALRVWLSNRSRVTEEILFRIDENRRLLRETSERSGAFQVLETEGGWSQVLEVPNGRDDEELSLRLLQRENVFTHPGYFFDFDSGSYMVVSLILPTDILREGLTRLVRVLS